jgi:hypothetical protein
MSFLILNKPLEIDIVFQDFISTERSLPKGGVGGERPLRFEADIHFFL